MSVSCVALAAALVAPAVAGEPGAVLARAGRALLPVVLAADPTAAERTAAEELAAYLERATSARFVVVPEPAADPAAPAIHVGPTALARQRGLAPEALGPEEWRLVTVDGSLVLAGGRPRGTLYAVYRFLEDHVGVRWWTAYEEHVPARPELRVAVDAGGRPAFPLADIQGIEGPAVFQARGRASGHHSFLTAAHGGREAWGPPFTVHTHYLYVPATTYFAEHPEFYAERDGVRVAERAQLCLASAALVDLVVARLDEFAAAGRAAAEAAGEPPPLFYDLSQNDFARPCTCADCRAVDERAGGPAGSVARFVNRVAERAAARHPELRIGTLAYRHTLDPPRGMRLGDNVVLRLAALFERDFAKPVTHPANRRVRRAIEGWSERTRHLWIWDYTVTYGWRPNNLPLPNLPIIAADLRHYLECGVEGLLVQHEHPVLSDMRDLKLWVLFKLVEDPTRDLDALARDFTDGFYGPAGATVREYLALLERAARRRPPAIRHPTSWEQFEHLDAAFLRRAQALFERAEAEVRGDAVGLDRLRRARVSLDRATLWRWDEALRRAEAPEGPPLDPREVAERLRRTAHAQIDLRFAPHQRAANHERLEDEIGEALSRIGPRPAGP